VAKQREQERIIQQRGLHHYLFAHQILPAAFYESPPVFVELMSSGKAGWRALIDLWSRAATQSMMAGFEPLDFDQRPAPPRIVKVASRYGILFEMPPPQAPTEAYFALALLPSSAPAAAAAATAITNPAAGPIYYTLERVAIASGDPVPDPPSTVLGAWTPTSHLNFGDGPPPQRRRIPSRG